MAQSLTKNEMINELNSGSVVRHRTFCGDETVKKTGSMYQFEDGIQVSPTQFWNTRSHDSFQTGWFVVS